MNESKKIEMDEVSTKEQKAVICWIREHKKEIAIVGISVATLVGLAWGIKNKEKIETFWDMLENNNRKKLIKMAVPEITEEVNNNESVMIPMRWEYKAPFEVSSHIRNLHEGWKASPEKLAKAATYRIDLLPGQTLVEGYKKFVV